MTKILFSILLTFSTCILTGQTLVSGNARFELEYKYSEYEFNIVNIEEEGLLLFRKKSGFFEPKKKQWEIYVLDTLLQEKKKFTVEVDINFHLRGYEYKRGFFYLLYGEGYYGTTDYHVYKINVEKGEWKTYKIDNELELELSHFLISENNVVFGGKIKNKPTVVHYSLEHEKIEVLPGFYRDDTDLVNIQENKNGTFNILFLEKEPATQINILNLKVFNSDGTLLMESIARFPEDIRVLSGSTNALEYSDLIVLGTYGERNNKLSQGLYFINMRPGEENQVKLIPYTGFDHFFTYLGDRREARIKEKIRLQSNYNFRSAFVIWDVKEKEEHYEIFGEITDPQYDPAYRTSDYYRNYRYNNPRYNYYNPLYTESLSRYYQSTHSLLDDDMIVSVKYKSAHAIVLNKQGELAGDYSMVMKNQEKSYMENVASCYVNNKGANFFYKDDEEIFYSFRNGKKEQETDSTLMVDDLLVNKKLRNEDDDGQVVYWYGDSFYVWGYQRISEGTDYERDNVFYINKIRAF